MLTGNYLTYQFECQVHRIWLDTMKCGHWIEKCDVCCHWTIYEAIMQSKITSKIIGISNLIKIIAYYKFQTWYYMHSN